MKVTTCKPERPKYTIAELTEEQAKGINALIAVLPSNMFDGSLYEVFSALDDVLDCNNAYDHGMTQTDANNAAILAIKDAGY